MRVQEITEYDDMRAMQSLTQRVWSPAALWHVGDLAWARLSTRGQQDSWRTAAWFDEETCLAWGWAELSGELSLVVDPFHSQLTAEVLRWFDQVATSGMRTCTISETETQLAESLLAEGYRPRAGGPFFRLHARSLADVPEPSLPDGFRARHVQPGEARARAAVHRAGWSDFGSTLSTETYERLMATWPYRVDLDWVVESPDGELVVSALAWLDDDNHAGLLEPVGCAPSYRRQGLAAAVNLAAMHALRHAGALTAHVNPRGDDAYPAPGLLYRRIGFLAGARTVTYLRGEPSRAETA